MSCNQNVAEDGTRSETATCLPPALTPDPESRLERGTMRVLRHPPTRVQRGPAQERQPGRTLAGLAGVAVGTRRGRPSKAHTH